MRVKKRRLVVSRIKPDGRASWAEDSKRLAEAGEAAAEWPSASFANEAEPKP
jgi:hypothetical protein